MGQNYSLRFKLGKANKQGLASIYLRYYTPSSDFLLPTGFKIPVDALDKDKLSSPVKANYEHHKLLNMRLNGFRVEVEQRILESKGHITIEYLLGQTASNDTLSAYILSLCDRYAGKFSEGTLRHYKVIEGKIEAYSPGATFESISVSWLQGLESFIRKTVGSGNTVAANMKKVVSILNKAFDDELISKEQFERYKTPLEKAGIPVYLPEKEIDSFFNIARSLPDGPIKTYAYYFLLGCYAGYRISDLFSFNYNERVHDTTIVIRAKKNGQIVSIAIYPKLAEVLEFVRLNEISGSEKDMREKVKLICKMAGINKDVKVHSARHSFAMLLLDKGLTVDEVAELLGDTPNVARRYARITNKQLQRRVLEVMK